MQIICDLDNETKIKPLTVTVKKAQEIIGLSNTSLWRLMKQGKLKTTVVCGRRLIHYDSIEDLLKDRTGAEVA